MNSPIGIDYGNHYAQAIAILYFDPQTHCGIRLLDLSDPCSPDPNGIPTAFFYSSKRNSGQPICGYGATKMRPPSNIVRYLKRNMHGSVTLDGRTFTYAEMITQTIQHCVREANRQLWAQTKTRTNEISLAYPPDFTKSEQLYLISLAEKATLEDGTPIKVVGSITEPAAVALNYLTDHPAAAPEISVMVYDLGAGTFNLSLLDVFPNGKQDSNGSLYYYDLRRVDDIPNLGGLEFDKLIYQLMIQKFGFTPTGQCADLLMQMAECTKRDLTFQNVVYPCTLTNDDVKEIEITIEEFNAAAAPLVQKTIELVKNALKANNVPRPDLILLTGGASRMRIVKEMLEKELPQYRGRIISYRPSLAIASGAARFGQK